MLAFKKGFAYNEDMVAHKEIELKFPITKAEHRALLERLSQKLPRADLTQNDFVVRTKFGENVRVRTENDRPVLTHKKKIYDDAGHFLYCRESECTVDKAHTKEIAEILKELGVKVPDPDVCADVNLFREFVKKALAPQMAFWVQLHKNRVEFKEGKNCTYVVDEVKNLGHFLEIELIAPLDDVTKEDELRLSLRQKLPALGLSDRDPITHGYTILMHEKQMADKGKQKNSRSREL